MSLHDRFNERLEGTQRAVDHVRSALPAIVTMAEAIRDRLEAGGTLFTCGNGGSAAEALHLAEELIGRYRADRAPIAASCFNADPTAITCIANDYGFDEIFARPARALIKAPDVLVVFTTSGNSENITRALRIARERGAMTIGLLGRDGGEAKPLCDHAVIVPGSDSAPIQEGHQIVMHLLCEAVDDLG
ncbi:MAG: SIS domain-containing protein [Planctomycetota bacterium]